MRQFKISVYVFVVPVFKMCVFHCNETSKENWKESKSLAYELNTTVSLRMTVSPAKQHFPVEQGGFGKKLWAQAARAAQLEVRS